MFSIPRRKDNQKRTRKVEKRRLHDKRPERELVYPRRGRSLLLEGWTRRKEGRLPPPAGDGGGSLLDSGIQLPSQTLARFTTRKRGVSRPAFPKESLEETAGFSRKEVRGGSKKAKDAPSINSRKKRITKNLTLSQAWRKERRGTKRGTVEKETSRRGRRKIACFRLFRSPSVKEKRG